MWKWDQGRMQYFQFDALRTMSSFITKYDFKNETPELIRESIGMQFLPLNYTPWRNYARILKLCFLIYEEDDVAHPTDIAWLLSKSGTVTCDEYFHFLVEVSTQPSPALQEWKQNHTFVRYPLCFSLKYMLAIIAIGFEPIVSIDEIVDAYIYSGFKGDESDIEFIELLNKKSKYIGYSKNINTRQAKESIKTIAQISYLHCLGNHIVVSLNRVDALDIFKSLNPISEDFIHQDGNIVIKNLSEFFKDGSSHDFFEYKNSEISEEVEYGFIEGGKVKKTHIVIERNSKLRSLYFKTYPSPICDSCNLNTHLKYPWVDKVLDVHHILPLSSGTRVDSRQGTILDDLVAICPTCHRAIHRYSDLYLKKSSKKDFDNRDEALNIYIEFKKKIIKGGYFE